MFLQRGWMMDMHFQHLKQQEGFDNHEENDSKQLKGVGCCQYREDHG